MRDAHHLLTPAVRAIHCAIITKTFGSVCAGEGVTLTAYQLIQCLNLCGVKRDCSCSCNDIAFDMKVV